MSNTKNNLRKNLLKGQEALVRYKTMRETILFNKEQIVKEIEEARRIWIRTLEQLPNQEFNQ